MMMSKPSEKEEEAPPSATVAPPPPAALGLDSVDDLRRRLAAIPTETARSMDELEGTLLPVATAITSHQEDPNVASATVIPSVESPFAYSETAPLIGEQPPAGAAPEEAVVVPDNGRNQLNYAGVSDDSKSAVGLAQRTGRIRAEEEAEAIQKANRKVFSQNYHERNSVKNANARAKQRDREGLQITNDRIEEQMLLSEKQKAAEQQQASKQQERKPAQKGYQISEYDIGTYDTTPYEISEYKSVYD